MPDAQPCKIAVIGAGYMAKEHLRAFRDIEGVELAGIFSRTRERAKTLAAEFGVAAVCDSVEELHDRTRADLVVVTVPELAMNATARRVFAFPWTVLLEKPAGYDLDDAADILARAKARGGRVHVALNRRFYSSARAVAAGLADLPGPRLVVIQDQQDQAAALAAGQPEQVVRNWMFANSIHTIDLMRFFGRGLVTKVTPVVDWTPGSPWVVVARVDFDSGDQGIYQGIWKGPGPWAVNVFTTGGRYEMRPLERAGWQAPGTYGLEALPIHESDTRFKPGLRLQAREAVKAALGQPSESTTINEAFESMRLVKDIFQAGEAAS